jgi:cytoskeletal protein RodZ
MRTQSFAAVFRSICFFFMGLTPPWRHTYSSSRQVFLPISAGAFPPRRTADSAKIEDRYHEMAKGTFGERLKRERELREVSLNEIATATRIAPKFLEALENEQWNKLPGGVFGHGFVRSIARYLGLNEEDLLSEYDLARAEAAVPAAQKPEERIPSPPKWIPAAAVLLLVAVLAGLFFGGRYAWRMYSARRGAKKTTAVVGIPAAAESKTSASSSSSYAPEAAAQKSAALELSVAASAATRVRVVADGTVVYDAKLPSGQNLRFSATEKFDVSAADSAAVLLELNGQTVPPIGTPGSSGTISLTAKDLRQASGGNAQP